MIAVTNVLQALLLQKIGDVRQQGLAEDVFRRDRVPTLGVWKLLDQRRNGLLHGAVGRNQPAERSAIAVLSGDFVSAGGSDVDTAGLLNLRHDRERFRRQTAAGEQPRAVLKLVDDL